MAPTRTARKTTAAANNDAVADATARVLNGETTFEQEAAAMLAPKPARRTAPKAAQTAATAPAPEPQVVAPAAAPKVRKPKLSEVPVAGCSLVDQTGTVHPCTEHKTYASDPHCRNRYCTAHIAHCEVHVLVKGGKVEIAQPQPVQQPQSRARRTR